MKLNILYFYPKFLNLYGDNGNVEILVERSKSRDIDVEVFPIDIDTKLDSLAIKNTHIVIMGGGPDSSQKFMYEDLTKDKSPFLKDYIENSGVGLFICGSYQLLGNYYKAADGSILQGVGIFDLFTEHFGNHKPRCIGNVSAKLSKVISEDPVFRSISKLGDTVVGFENHGGRTYLEKNVTPMAEILKGHGNNSEDKTEGVVYKNSIGSYFHGPFLSKNPHLADYLIAKSLKIDSLKDIDDTIINLAHAAALNLKQ